MFRLSPRRNQRSKGFKVKHALQICLLLGVCIWLLYQVRHSNEKKAAYEKSGNEVVKLGRKDLPQAEETTIRDARHKEEEEEVENKPEDTENVGRENGDDDAMHEHDNDKPEEETEHREVAIDGEKENEERRNNDSEEKETEETKEKEGEEKGIKEKGFHLLSIRNPLTPNFFFFLHVFTGIMDFF